MKRYLLYDTGNTAGAAVKIFVLSTDRKEKNYPLISSNLHLDLNRIPFLEKTAEI